MGDQVSASPPSSNASEVPHPPPAATSGMTAMRGLLVVVAWLILGAAIITAMVLFAMARRAVVPTPLPHAILLPLIIAGAALILALVYFALAVLIRGQLLQMKLTRFMVRNLDHHVLLVGNLERQLQEMRQVIESTNSTAVSTVRPPDAEAPESVLVTPAPVAPALSAEALAPIQDLLIQLRDAALLSEPQRRQWAAGLLEKRKAAMAKDVYQAMNAEQWKTAAGLIAKFRESVPGDPLADTLMVELTNKQNEKIQQELNLANGRLQQLMAINAWDQVEQIVETLESRYVDNTSVQELVNRVQREREAWQRESLQSLMDDYKDALDHRQWVRACNLAQQILERYPEDKLADKVRGNLSTLRQNAEIQTRHELETQYADLIKRRRHEEALAIAERVMESYPDSPTAKTMRQHLPKLLEIIKQEKTRRESTMPKT
ncbi:MAG: hypothetical protein M1472_01120 [Planctomycetes bacterium]|jgi:TolA-binding protein|nr:hypothetical protein [Planctomycetota bacterium]MDA8375467.1 hypothetical protein [Planctomycetia bacterium]